MMSRNPALRIGALLVLAALSGCARKDADQSADNGMADQPAVSPPLTGILTEEEFKALHELRTDAPPPAEGTMIEIAGSAAYLSLPDGSPPFPGIVVIHEWWGLNDHIKHWSDRLAADGYAALAVDLYGGKVAETPDDAMSYVRSVDEPRAQEILAAAHAFLAADPRVQAPARGSIGWCFGGGWSLRHAIAAADLDAAVIYYGQPVSDVETLRGIRGHVLGIFANRDGSITPDAVDAFESALAEAGVSHSIHRYDADHAFANPSSARYDQPAATEAWTVVRSFLDAHLRERAH